MNVTPLISMKVKTCMKIDKTRFDHPETIQNENVKLGWG